MYTLSLLYFIFFLFLLLHLLYSQFSVINSNSIMMRARISVTKEEKIKYVGIRLSKVTPLLRLGSVWCLPATPHEVDLAQPKFKGSLSTNTSESLPSRRNHCLFPYLTFCLDFYLLFMSGHETNSVALMHTFHEYIHCCICQIKFQLLCILFRQYASCCGCGAHSGNRLLNNHNCLVYDTPWNSKTKQYFSSICCHQ